MPVDHSKNIIEVRDVSFSYGQKEVLSKITLDIHQGDYLGVVGPNGAGKTTFIKLILGLLPLSHGSIKLFGKDINKFKDRTKIGYVPQKATNFDSNFPVTVKEVVDMGRFARRGLFHGLKREDNEIIEQALRQVDMWDYHNNLIGDLSAGQQQRVFIARALAAQPEIIFLDEPTTGVDERNQDEFYKLLSKLNKELHLTLILISHDIERVVKEVMHIACINRTLTCHMSPQEYLPENRKIFTFHHHH